MAHDVFVSYSNKDKNVANAVVAGLEGEGIRCWIAPRDITPGRSWGEAINEAIEGSRFMVIVLSANSNQSKQVVREVERAVAHNVIIIPFRIEDIDPTGAMAYFLSTEHWLDALTPPLEKHIQKLVQTIKVFQTGETPKPSVGGLPTKKRKFPFYYWVAAFGVLVVVGLAIFLVPKWLNPSSPGTIETSTPTSIQNISETPFEPTVTASPTPSPAMTLLGSFSTSREARNIFVQGETVFLANGEDGLRILDVSDPIEPIEIGSYASVNAENVIVDDAIAYVVEQGQVEGGLALKDRLLFIDVNNPSTPKLLGEYTVEDGFAHQSLSNISVSDGVAYITLSDSLIAIDVSNPSEPIAIGEFTFSSNISSPGIVVVEGIAYLQANELHVVDFRDPNNPVEIGGFDAGWGAGIVIIDQKAYIAGWSTGLTILDISDPARPIKLGSFMEMVGNYELIPKGAASRQTLLDIAVSGEVAYLSYSFGIDQGTWTQILESGVVALDVSDPSNPVMLDKYSEFDNVTSVKAMNELVLVSDGTRGLLILSKPQ